MTALSLQTLLPASPGAVPAALVDAAGKMAMMGDLASGAIRPRAGLVRQYGYHRDLPFCPVPIDGGSLEDDEALAEFCQGLALAFVGLAHGQPVDPLLRVLGAYGSPAFFRFDPVDGVDGPLFGFSILDLCRSTWQAGGTLHLTPVRSPFRMSVIDIDLLLPGGGFLGQTEAQSALSRLQSAPSPDALAWKAWFEGKGKNPAPAWDGGFVLQ